MIIIIISYFDISVKKQKKMENILRRTVDFLSKISKKTPAS